MKTSTTRSYNRGHARGFTMIELVIALSLLSLIVGVTYSCLQQIIRTKKLLDDSRDGRLIANAVLTRMTRELQLVAAGTTLMPSREDGDRKVIPRLSLQGKNETIGNGSRGDSITFMAQEGGQYLPDGGTHSGIVQITYRVEKDPEAQSGELERFYLIRDETPNIRPFDKAFEKTMTFPITSDLLGLQFEYFDPDNERWVAEWGENNAGRLPSMIRFSLQLATPSGKTESYSTAVAIRSAGY